MTLSLLTALGVFVAGLFCGVLIAVVVSAIYLNKALSRS